MPQEFGWLHWDIRTQVQNDAHDTIMASLPNFKIVGKSNDNVKKVALYDCNKAVNGGKHFRTFYQKTGSCVGNGLGQALWTLEACEVVRLQQNETPKCPFWLLPYGRSRFYIGDRGQGEGSTGSAAAKAITTDGTFEFDESDVPQPSDEDGLTWGKDAEMTWSDGAAISQKFLDRAKKHLVKSAAQMKSADDCRAALQNYYPLTCASSWGGNMKPQERDGVLLNSHTDEWNHQMSVHAWQEHGTLGEIFLILNSWGVNAHGQPPDDAPPGSFWVLKKDMDWICRTGEVFALSQFDGFPGQDLAENLFKIIGNR